MTRISQSTGLDTDTLDSELLAAKQDRLFINNQPINPTVLSTFGLTIGDGYDQSYENSLVSALALEQFLESDRENFIQIQANTQPGVRVTTINAVSPSPVNVPTCSAVSNLVSTLYQPKINNTVNFTANQITANQISLTTSPEIALNESKVPTAGKVHEYITSNSVPFTRIIGENPDITGPHANIVYNVYHGNHDTATKNVLFPESNRLVTEGKLLNYIDTNSNVTKTGFKIIEAQSRLYSRSITETDNVNFQWIESGVHDITSGFDTTKDNAIATQACMHNHLIATCYQKSEVYTKAETYDRNVIDNLAFVRTDEYPFTFNNNVLSTTGVTQFNSPKLQMASTRGQSMSVTSFEAFKTTASEILADSTPEPISCTAYTNAGATATISAIDANDNNLLSPNGFVINSHLTSNYQPLTDLTIYLTTSDAANTYQTQNAMSSYLTIANAASTYQPITDLSVYLQASTAASTYQTQSAMSSYLTTSAASSLYQTQAAMADYLPLTGGTVTGDTTFSGILTGTASGNIPIPSSGSGANKVVARNAANNAWEFATLPFVYGFALCDNARDLGAYTDESYPRTDEVPTDASDWREFPSWNTIGSGTSNTNDTSSFTITSTGFTVLKAGHYRITCQMFFSRNDSDRNHLSVGVRLAKNGTMFGPISVGYIRGGQNTTHSASVISVQSLSTNDTISAFTVRYGPTDSDTTPDIVTAAGVSQFLIETC